MKRMISWLLALVSAATLGASESGESVVVIFNTRVPESKGIANHYAEVRHVPENQLLGLSLPVAENMTRDEYNNELLAPLVSFLDRQKLFTFATAGDKPGRKVTAAKIRYAVLCYGVPVRILPDPKLITDDVKRLQLEMQRNEAAVDNELALLPLAEQKYPLQGPFKNVAYGATNAAVLDPTNGVLMVARLDGPTAKIARELVDKAIQAENDGLWGRAYFDLRGLTNGGYKIGDDALRDASRSAIRFGFETVVDENPEVFGAGFPMSQIALYAGWYSGNAIGPFARPEVEFMPGAIAYHLHSYSAAHLRSPTENWVGPFLAKGVTATLGSVDEPYLAGTPDMAVFMNRLLFAGLSFGEAAYACQGSLSWQTTVVGDPLYRPFLKTGAKLHQELGERNSPMLAWSNLRIVNLNLATGVARAAMIGYLQQTPLTLKSSILCEKLGDLLVGEKKNSDAADAYTRAMRNPVSPQQAIRVLLALAEQQTLLARDAQALETYQVVLNKIPDYPDRLSVLQKALPLAEKLKKSDDAEQYRKEITKLSSPGK